jgi:hypothetical protein
MSRVPMKYSFLTLAAGLLSLGVTTAQADQVITDDLIVQNSLCVGFDCVNNESFGFDTIRLKENNTRIKFQDTSASSSFPSVDWQLTANDSSNGGANKFSIDDIDNGRTPFTITAGARANAIFVNSAGRVGFGTATPSVDLHVRQGNTPTLRLEQDGSSGFAAQTWDVAGNESGFFVRDVTNGGQLPFRIIPGADSSSIAIGANNNVGVGAGTSPDAALHVERNDGTAQVLVKDTSAAAGNLTMLLLDNAGGRPRFQMTGAGNAGQTGDWSISAGDTFVLQDRISSINAMVIEQSGNMTITGALTQNSDKNNKMAIVPVAHDEILAKVAALPISAWTYKNDAERGIRHIGPMAQDFYAAFETGAGPTGISTIDTGGVALAAIKALSEENNAQRDLIAQLSSRLEALEGQISK